MGDSDMSTFVTRFAPSPTGRLHLGHAASAFHVWRAAEAAGGEALLRIEDIDTTRCRPEFTAAIFEDLRWLGFRWPEPVRIQSEHFEDYHRVVSDLASRGLAYRCFRTRSDIQAEPLAPLSPSEEERKLASGAPFAWRLSLRAAREEIGAVWKDLSFRVQAPSGLETMRAQPETQGDIIIARKDSPSAYHIAATHDDALQGITHVIRGEDLVEAPHIQVVLQVLMGWPSVIYQHHTLVLGSDGQRLAKSHGSISLAALRASGMSVEDIRSRLGF